MPPKTLLRVGAVALSAGILLVWTVPIWLRLAGLYEWDYDQIYPVLFWFCVSLAGAGGLLLLHGVLRLFSPESYSEQKMALFPSMVPRNVMRWRSHRPTPRIAQLPNFGLIYGAVLWILIFLFMIVEIPQSRYGLPISLRTHDPVVWEKSPWQETLGVYLAAGEKYYINGEFVPKDELRIRLQRELNKRLVWTVYFEGDNDTLYMNSVYAIDAIQSCGAKVIWITPRMREEWQRKTLGRN